ncbi:MAG: hypothetical protein ACR2KH_02720 [Sphingomicrobium sp.]
MAPGASAVAFIGSVTRLSMWPVMITTSLGLAVPRWTATALQTRVGVRIRRPVTASQVCRVVSPKLFIRASAQRTAAPIPRFRSVCDDIVCRVPKLTSFSTVRFISAPPGAMIRLSFASGEADSQAFAALPTSSRHGIRARMRITRLLSALLQLAFAAARV